MVGHLRRSALSALKHACIANPVRRATGYQRPPGWPPDPDRLAACPPVATPNQRPPTVHAAAATSALRHAAAAVLRANPSPVATAAAGWPTASASATARHGATRQVADEATTATAEQSPAPAISSYARYAPGGYPPRAEPSWRSWARYADNDGRYATAVRDFEQSTRVLPHHTTSSPSVIVVFSKKIKIELT